MKEGTVEKNSKALPRTVRSPQSSSSLPPPFLLSSGEGSLGEIQTLQECYHCIALAAFPGSFNRLQTPLLHRVPVFVSLLIRVCVQCTSEFLSVYLRVFFVFFPPYPFMHIVVCN